MIRYKVIGGSIPEGTRVVSDRGVMSITGVAPLDLSLNPPSISTPAGLIAIIDELEPATINLEVSANGGKSLEGCAVIDGSLPWGLKLRGSTISGTVAELMTKDPVSFLPEDAPVWSTRDGLLASLNEFQEYSSTLATETPAKFQVVAGTLPWGLRLLPNGILAGKTREAGGEAEPVGPGPIWTTARGRLSTLNEFQTVEAGTLGVSASPRTGSNIYYSVHKGALPWGLKINTRTGEITGKAVELQIGDESDNPNEASKPTLTGKTFSGVAGALFTETVSINVPQGRSAMSIRVSEGHLPFGLKLKGSTISGIPLYPGSHQFSLEVIDSEHIHSNHVSFTFEVTT